MKLIPNYVVRGAGTAVCWAVVAATVFGATQALAQAAPAADDEIEVEGPDIEVEDTTETPATDAGADDGLTATPIDLPDAKSAGLAESKSKYKVSWSDIVVVPRKAFLKRKRIELQPFFGSTINDNMITHRAFGGQLAYYLSENLAIGAEGTYMLEQTREPFDLVARQARRLPTVNQYKWSAMFNMQYVPIYGKFALLNKKIITWEAYFTGGAGVINTEVLPRDTRFDPFTNYRITFHAGASLRFFLSKFLTVNVGIRDYIFSDKFEPENRSESMFASAEDAKDNAGSALINNVMFQIGIGFWLPPTFEYTTFR